MPNPRLASRYAKSLFDLVVEKNSLEDTLKDMELLQNICKQSRDFEVMLRSPIIKADKKQSILNAILKDSIHPVTKAFVTLLVNKGREANLPEIAQAFIAQYKETKKIKTVKLTTAVAVNDHIKEAIRTKVTNDLSDYSVELHAAVDAELIGGFVLEMEDRLFDASVRKELNDIKAKFLDNSYVSNLR